ncbi:hypothetical protein F5ESL0233_04095 [Lactobacillus sp. ESL0233]|nr:hypothetical protein F5ESL0233_04095 [Lactobacillus sp. ESL0233]
MKKEKGEDKWQVMPKETKSKRDLRSNELFESSITTLELILFLLQRPNLEQLINFAALSSVLPKKLTSTLIHLLIFLTDKRTMQPSLCLFVVI